ncbi:MAG: cytidine deaminase [Bacteroidia bacterium]
MIKREHKVPYEWHEDTSTLSEEERRLLEEAMKATEHSYAPYSGFFVGCAVGLESGEIVLGSNQENAAYPSGLCAERVALFAIGAAGKEKGVRMMAIRARTASHVFAKPPTSCGDCRQVMLEFEHRAGESFTVLCQGEEGPVLKIEGVAGGLLPFPFEF